MVNMVRAGVVSHPSEWTFSGYNETQRPSQRYALINHKKLMNSLGIEFYGVLKDAHKSWVEESFRHANNVRDSKWFESIAVGSEAFVEKTKEQLGVRTKGRVVEWSSGRAEKAAQQQNSPP